MGSPTGNEWIKKRRRASLVLSECGSSDVWFQMDREVLLVSWWLPSISPKSEIPQAENYSLVSIQVSSPGRDIAGSHIIIYILERLWLGSLPEWDINEEGRGERTHPRCMRKQNWAPPRFTVGGRGWGHSGARKRHREEETGGLKWELSYTRFAQGDLAISSRAVCHLYSMGCKG